MFYIIIILESRPGVVLRINEDALNLTRELLLDYLECRQVVAEDEAVVQVGAVRDAIGSAVGLLRVFNQNPRLKFQPIFFAIPSYFKFGFRVAILILAYILMPEEPRR